MKPRLTVPLFVLLAVAVPAAAQDIGFPPAASPYRDLVFRQELTTFGGYYRAGADPAGVAPQSGPMAGVRYEIRIAGPAAFFARVSGVASERTELNPRGTLEQRVVGTASNPLLLADVGMSFNVTGQKSWRGLVPVLAAGLGVATDFQPADAGGYRFGTPFALSFGGGIRWVPGGRLQLRVDVTDHLYQIRYPSSYFQAPITGIDPILEPDQKQNVWKHNAALTVGASYLFFR